MAKENSISRGSLIAMPARPDWDVYFLLMAQVAAARSTCMRRKVGAVLVRGRQILSTGYNGDPRVVPHC